MSFIFDLSRRWMLAAPYSVQYSKDGIFWDPIKNHRSYDASLEFYLRNLSARRDDLHLRLITYADGELVVFHSHNPGELRCTPNPIEFKGGMAKDGIPSPDTTRTMIRFVGIIGFRMQEET